jgi:MinD superfamily P-loop ATPase
MVIINKYDLNLENTANVETFCKSQNVEVLGRIPFDSIMTKSMVAAQTLPEFAPDHQITLLLKQMWHRVENVLANL